MSVTQAKIVDINNDLNDDGSRVYNVIYEVHTDDADDGPITARLGTPSRLSRFSFGNDADVGAILKRKRSELVSAREHYKLWRVTCTYDSTIDTEDNNDETDDPLLRPTKWSGSYVQFSKDLMKDRDGNQIKNSAGDPFIDPPIVADDSRMSIVATKNFGSLNLNLWAQFRDAINNATWWGLAAKKLKVQSITWDQNFFEGIPFYAVRYEFHINDDTWDDEILQAGFYERVGGKRQRISEKLGRDINSPWPLTTAGVALTEAQIDSDSEAYLTIGKYPQKDFSQLSLPAVIGAP